MKKKISALILSAIMTVTLCGCNNQAVLTSRTEQKEISLSWWGNDKRNEYTIEAIRQFEKLNPDIKVNLSYSEWSGYLNRYDVQMISHTEADVMQINFGWIDDYSPDGNGYYDLNTLSDTLDLTQFTKEELDFGMKNGKLNAIPIALNTQTMYINKTVYEKYGLDIPKSWEDLFSAAKVMNGKTYPVAMNSKPAFFMMLAYAEQKTGKAFLDSNGKLAFGPDDLAVMIDFYCSLIKEKVMPQPEYFERNKIATDEYGGFFAWLSDAASYSDKAIESGYEYVISDYPCSAGSKLSSWYAKPATMYAISNNTSYPKEAARLLEFLLNSEEMAELQGIEKGIPLSESARNYLEKNDKLEGMQYNAFIKMSENSGIMDVLSPYFENSDILDAFTECCNAVYYEKDTTTNKSKELYEIVKKIVG